MNNFGNIGDIINQFQGFMKNPVQFMAQRKLNIPQEVFNNPQAAVQQLMNNGQMSQQQFNQLQQMAKQIQNNPQFMSLFKK